jgi:hypothetical protein
MPNPEHSAQSSTREGRRTRNLARWYVEKEVLLKNNAVLGSWLCVATGFMVVTKNQNQQQQQGKKDASKQTS